MMPKWRFKKLGQYFHCNNNETVIPLGQDGYDVLHKIRPLVDSVGERFKHHYNPGFKGRCFMKQYLPAKPTKWGFKLWTIAESKTGYISTFKGYTGRRNNQTRNGLGYDVVMSLSEGFRDVNRHLYFDNYFSSILLMIAQKAEHTLACATIRMMVFLMTSRGLDVVTLGLLHLVNGAVCFYRCGTTTRMYV